MYKEWLPIGSHGGRRKTLTDGVSQAFDWIKGSIHLVLASLLAKTVMMELHGKFLMHFRAMFITEVYSYYLILLSKSGGCSSLHS